jgi:hypothetical protein
MVWLQLIPLFNFYWIFVVVTRIADSINKENLALQDDTILGIPDYDAVKAVGKRPTYKIGITYCITALLGPLFTIFVNLFGNELTPDFYQVFMTILGGLSLAAMTCWIIYWVKLAANKRKLMYLHA